MNKSILYLLLFFLSFQGVAQEITGEELLEKSMNFHDPDGKWETFKGTLYVTMQTPKRPERNSEIKIDLPEEYFYVKASQGKNTTEYTLDKGKCSLAFNGDANPSDEIKKKNGLSCDRAKMYSNYYTYLYGLPMKMKDPGAIIDNKIIKKTFKGKNYLVLKVTYKKEVGKDTWYLYFNPKTYAMEIYQFFKDESKNDGEYILLTGMHTVNGIKMPKTRAWYYNKDDKYLGTDTLKASF